LRLKAVSTLDRGRSLSNGAIAAIPYQVASTPTERDQEQRLRDARTPCNMQYVLYDDGGFPPEFCRSEMQARMTTRNGLSKRVPEQARLSAESRRFCGVSKKPTGRHAGKTRYKKAACTATAADRRPAPRRPARLAPRTSTEVRRGAPRVRAPPGGRLGVDRPRCVGEKHPAARASRSACIPQRVHPAARAASASCAPLGGLSNAGSTEA
jgi:hypothetical protein